MYSVWVPFLTFQLAVAIYTSLALVSVSDIYYIYLFRRSIGSLDASIISLLGKSGYFMPLVLLKQVSDTDLTLLKR